MPPPKVWVCPTILLVVAPQVLFSSVTVSPVGKVTVLLAVIGSGAPPGLVSVRTIVEFAPVVTEVGEKETVKVGAGAVAVPFSVTAGEAK